MIRRVVNWLAILTSIVLLVAACLWFYFERRWSAWDENGPSATPYSAFVAGPIGLEVFPLKYAVVLNKISREAFLRDPEAVSFSDPTSDPTENLSVWEAYGFLPNPASTGQAPCGPEAGNELPFGFAVTDYLPLSAVETPVEFVGFTCAACHSGRVRHTDGFSEIVVGMGNPELDVIGFSDAVRTAILDPKLTVDAIYEAYGEICPAPQPDGMIGQVAGWIEGQIERQIIAAWIDQFRSTVADEIGRYGPPRWPHGPEIHSADTARHLLEPAGPGRTRPFRSVVRVTLELPGVENMAFSKIPAVFEQRSDLRPRSQFDGSILDPVTRSFIAAYASGATPTALAKPEIARSVRQAAAYTETLGIDAPLPAFAATFPALAPSPQEIAAGRAVYRTHCVACHGDRDPVSGAWVPEGSQLHEIAFLKDIGTDPERVLFPNGPLLPLSLWTALPQAGAPLDAQKARLAEARDAALAAHRYAEAQLWSDQLERLNLNSRRFRLGH
ncbi:MAG: cytochrome c, partial [Pseudomonadota bacterium]